MKDNMRIVLAVTFLALAALACQAVAGGGGTPTADVPFNPVLQDPTPVEPTESVSQDDGDVIFRDDFSSPQWDAGQDIGSDIEYVNDALNFVTFTSNVFVWSTPNDEVYKDIHMEVTVLNHDTDPETAFGFICNKSEGGDFYYLVITPGGQYAIALAKDGAEDVFLTNNDQWAYADLITENSDTYRIGADCGNGMLALYVDGQEIASVADSTYTEGGVALMIWSAEEEGKKANVSFDDFVMMELP